MALPRLYDIATDQWRDVTHADVEQAARTNAAFGRLVTYLRKTLLGAEPAQIAVEDAQGKLPPETVVRLYDSLLQEGA